MRVQGANVLVKKINDKVAGSIFIPSFGNMGYCYCEVVAVGKGAYFMPKDELIPLQIKVGDRTLINQGVMEEYEIVKNRQIGSKGNYVYFIVSDYSKDIIDLIK